MGFRFCLVRATRTWTILPSTCHHFESAEDAGLGCDIAQPDYKAALLSANTSRAQLCQRGNIAHHTAAKKKEHTTTIPRRRTSPPTGLTVYCNRIREAYDVPIIIGGLDVSLRRLLTTTTGRTKSAVRFLSIPAPIYLPRNGLKTLSFAYASLTGVPVKYPMRGTVYLCRPEDKIFPSRRLRLQRAEGGQAKIRRGWHSAEKSGFAAAMPLSSSMTISPHESHASA